MSGSLGILGTIGAAILGGSPLVLGGMVFLDFALPPRITYGGQQQLTIHKLPGGSRVIDRMGDDPVAVTWGGLFLGPFAAMQRNQLEAMRVAGQPVPLAWGDRACVVIVADARYDEEHLSRRIAYQVTCVLVPPRPPAEAQEADTQQGFGNGETPDTPAEARDQGRQAITRARSSAAPIPIPPLPPGSFSVGAGQG